MSDSYGTNDPRGSGAMPTQASGTIDTAKQEAAAVKDTATEQAKDVLGTAKDEATSVLVETKAQAKDLYRQTQSELKEQANTQQQRIAEGLRSVGDELDSMAAGAQGGGIATDLVGQAANRLSSAATWLGDRDPSSVLDEVKRFARRKPGTFILAALVAGVVVGRLARALAANASDEKEADSTASSEPALAATTDAWPPATVDPLEETPIYSQAKPAFTDVTTETGDDRPYAV